jgi:4-amino-4-deoxy-L-arabinose transferase-like glycosyltransferase
MTGTKPNADRVGFTALMLPLAAMALYALSVISLFAGFPMLGLVSMGIGILLLLLSIPINATLVFLGRRTYPHRRVQALVGLLVGIMLSVALLVAMRAAHLKKEAISQQFRESEVEKGNPD